MRVPLELSFRGVEKTEAIERYIRDSVRKLEKVSDAIVSCRVAVEQPQQHQRAGSPFRVRIDLRVPPKHELVVRRESSEGTLHDDLRMVLSDAFDAARRQLKELMQRLQGEVKTHPEQEEQVGVVVRIFREEGYGFLRTLEGQEVYFHENSVLRDDFARVDVGTAVRYVAELGEEGLQTTTVEIVDKPGPHREHEEATATEPPLGWKARA